MSTTPQSRKRRQSRSSSILERDQSPQQSPSRDEPHFDRQNCSTPSYTRQPYDSDSASPGYGCSDLQQLSQEAYMRVEVGWKWDSPKMSPVTKKIPEKRIETPVVKREESPDRENRILRSQNLKRRRKPPKEEPKRGFHKFKEEFEELMAAREAAAREEAAREEAARAATSNEVSEMDEKSGCSKEETTADLLQYVLDDSSFNSFNREKTLVNPTDNPGPSTAKPLLEKDSFFNNSAIDRDLCCLMEENLENPPPLPPCRASRPGSTQSVTLSEFSQKTSSDEFYYTVENCVQRLTQDIEEERKPISSREKDLKGLIDDSFDEFVSQMPLDGASNSRNTSFGRHASMPTQKQTVSQVAGGSSKGIFRYDSMPINSTAKKEDALSRNGSLESVSSSSSKCSSKEIELKRKEAIMRLNNLKQRQLLQQKKSSK